SRTDCKRSANCAVHGDGRQDEHPERTAMNEATRSELVEKAVDDFGPEMRGQVDLLAVHRRVLAETGRVVAAIGADQWHLATPCGDWDVSNLLQHMVAGNYWAAELASGRTIAEVGNRLDGDLIGPDGSRAYAESARSADAAFSVPGAM